MKKTFIGLVAMAGLICAGQASATTLESTILDYGSGPVSFKFSGYTQTDTPRFVNDPEVQTSGAFAITSFFKSVTAGAAENDYAAWRPTEGNNVYALMGGFYDIPSGDPATIWSKEGSFTLWETAKSWDLTKGPGVMATIPNDAKLLLAGSFVPDTTKNNATLVQSYLVDPKTGDFSGSGNAYASVTDGSLKNILDTNSQKFGSDLWLSFNYSHTGNKEQKWGPNGVFITDPAIGEAGNPIPEPVTMLLFGFGLIGLAGVGRKIQK